MTTQFGRTLIDQKNDIKHEINDIDRKVNQLYDEIDTLEKRKGELENELINWEDLK